MNKKLIIVLLVMLLCAALCFAACTEEIHKVKITCDEIKLPVGADVNWKDYVTVTVDDVKADNPEISADLKSGDPSKAGKATYILTYVYNNQSYTTTASVDFFIATHDVRFDAATIQVNVGQNIDWSNFVTVTVDGTVTSGLQFTSKLVGGDPAVAGQCTYRLSVQIDGQTYTSGNIAVTYTSSASNPAVVISCPVLTVQLGTTPDWAANVTVTVNGVPVSNPQITAKLDAGSESVSGVAEYVLTFKYEGTEYTQSVKVQYVEEAKVLFGCDPFTAYIGQDIDWAAKAIPIVNGSTVSNSQITAELISGNPSAEGECKYKLTFKYQSRDYTCEATVTYVNSPNLNETEGKALEAMFKKQYASLKFTYKYEVPEDGAWILQEESVQGSSYFVRHAYHIPSLSEPDVDENYYLDVDAAAQTIRIVYQNTENSKWYYQITDFDQAIKDDMAPYMFTVADVSSALTYGMFEKAGENTYKASNRYLNTVAGEFLDLQTASPESVIIKTDGTNITELKITYTDTDDQGDFRVIVTYNWEDFNNTAVEIPEAEKYVAPAEKPDFPDPSQSTDLTADETANLTSALAKTYDKISYGYNIDSGAAYFINTYFGVFDSTSQKGYHNYKEWAILSGKDPVTGETVEEEWIYESAEYYIKQLQGSLATYQMVGTDYIYGTATDVDYISWQNDNYISVAAIALRADLFGKLGDKYIVKADKLAEAYALINQIMSLEGSDFLNVTLQTCVVTLDADNNVTEIYFVLHGTTAKDKEVYKQCTLTYKDFDTAAVTLPVDEQLENLTADQTTELNNALKAENFANVTITESVSESIFKFDGDGAAALEHLENQYQYVQTDYIFKDGAWFKKLGQETENLTQAFEQLVLTFDFTKLDVSSAKYNTLNGSYSWKLTNEQILEFAQYYYNFADLYKESTQIEFGGFKGVSVTVEDGKVTKVTLYADEMSVSATFSDYGTTVLTADEAVA